MVTPYEMEDSSMKSPDPSTRYLNQLSDEAIRDQVRKMVKEKNLKYRIEKQKQISNEQEEAELRQRSNYVPKKINTYQQYLSGRHENQTTPKNIERPYVPRRAPSRSPDKKSLNYDELKKIKERYTFVGRSPNVDSEEKMKRIGKIEVRFEKKHEKIDTRRNPSPAKKRQPKDILPDQSPTQSQNSSKDSGISGSTKTEIDLMQCVYSNDGDSELEKAEKLDRVGSPPARRKAIVKTINNDAKYAGCTNCRLIIYPSEAKKTCENDQDKKCGCQENLKNIAKSGEQDVSEFSENEIVIEESLETFLRRCVNSVSAIQKDGDQTDSKEIDQDILDALNDNTKVNLGNKINENLARLWTPILQHGMSKESKEKLMQEYLMPQNCRYLQAPKLNKVIYDVIPEFARSRDKRRENIQQQLGLGITALNKGLELLLDNGNNRLQAIKYLSDSCRLLCDSHYIETQSRRNCILQKFDKSLQSTIQGDRDETLFGKKLKDKIKKRGLALKKEQKIIQTLFTSAKRTVSPGFRNRSPARSPLRRVVRKSSPQRVCSTSAVNLKEACCRRSRSPYGRGNTSM